MQSSAKYFGGKAAVGRLRKTDLPCSSIVGIRELTEGGIT